MVGGLISTKLVAPDPRPGAVERVVLRERIESGIAAGRRLTLVSAPAGYGKTTLVAAWLAHADRSAAWLTLDAADGDPARFAAYLGAAIGGGNAGVDDLIQAGAPNAEAVLAPLLERLAAPGGPTIVVLDDYHVIAAPHVHEIVAFLAAHLPGDAHLVILTREDPPLPLARLRARDQLTEIRAADLRFGRDEVGAFLATTMGLKLDQRSLATLAERTEGWAAGLQLAALAIRDAEDPDAAVERFGASDRYLVDFLAEEVLAHQPPPVRSFLEATAILERLSGPLCDALTGRDDGAAMLEALERANLFLAPLDRSRAWYRYHGLFAGALRSTVGPARSAELHRRAAAWLAVNDLAPEAIRHALAGGDTELAARLIEVTGDEALGRGELRTLDSWLDALPEALVAGRPPLRLLQGWVRFQLGDPTATSAAIDGLVPADLGEQLAGRLLALRALLANMEGRDEARSLAESALRAVDPGDTQFRLMALAAAGQTRIGRDAPGARRAFAEAVGLAEIHGPRAQALLLAYPLVMSELALGRRRAAVARCEEMLAHARLARGWLPAAGPVLRGLGVARAEADELEAAREHLVLGRELAVKAGTWLLTAGGADWAEIRVGHLLGDAAGAWDALRRLRREADRRGYPRILASLDVLRAELLLREGDVPAAAQALAEAPAVGAGEPLNHTLEPVACTHARVALAQGRPGQALTLLAAAGADQRAAGRRGSLLRVLVLAAAAHDAIGERLPAARALKEAIAIAAPEDLRRAFLDEPAVSAALLPAARAAAPAFVDGLLQALGVPGRSAPAAGGAAAARAAAGPGQVPTTGEEPIFAEALSAREFEVLRLVAAGLSNAEIGHELFISTGTAKWHVHNVLGKLGVARRSAAGPRARALGLLRE